MLYGYNRLFDEMGLGGDAGGGVATSDPTLDPALTALEGTTNGDATGDESAGDAADVNPFLSGDELAVGAIPETLLDKATQDRLASTDEGKELLETYSLSQKYKDAGLGGIPDPEVMQVALEKSRFFDALDADLSKGDIDAVLRGLTTQVGKDGQIYITQEGAQLIAGLPNFLQKLPDAEYAAATTPVIDQHANFCMEKCRDLYQQAQQYRDAGGKFTPQGAKLMDLAKGYLYAVQIDDINLYGEDMMSSAEDILAGRRAKDRMATSPQYEAMRKREMELSRREKEVQEMPQRQVMQYISQEAGKSLDEIVGKVAEPLGRLLPQFTPKGIAALQKEFSTEVAQGITKSARYEQVRTLIKAAQGGDPDSVRKAVTAYQGLAKRVAFELWPKWSGERVTSQKGQQMARKAAGAAVGSQGTGGTATPHDIPQFRARGAGESTADYRKAKEDHLWKHTGGKVWTH